MEIMNFFVKTLQGAEGVLAEGVKDGLANLKTEALADFDALFGKLKVAAVNGAHEVEQAVASGALTAPEKRSALITKLEQEAEALGYSLEQDGIAAAINLATEFGANLIKLITGGSVAAPAGQTSDKA